MAATVAGVSGLGILQAKKRPVFFERHCYTSADWPSPMMLTITSWDRQETWRRKDQDPDDVACTISIVPSAGIIYLHVKKRHVAF